ncbi:hypothetical protein MMC16_000425 [Acarospora aff. strigata]|nr:hypothetical protein [Acarospora aff. strigata]
MPSPTTPFRLQKKPTPNFSQKLTHLRTPLHPLLHITTGAPHPSFPRTLLHYHLLTSAELDDLASFYGQRTPGVGTGMYPYNYLCDEGSRRRRSLGWRREGMGLEEKRRKFGRFVGLRGCESPTATAAVAPVRESSGTSAVGDTEVEMEMEMGVEMLLDTKASLDTDMDWETQTEVEEKEKEREMREEMEREWARAVRRGREREEDERRVRSKVFTRDGGWGFY